jgi:hypothetical protein
VILPNFAVPPESPATLNAVDFNFVGQANLGAPFQVDSGRLAEAKGRPAATPICWSQGIFPWTRSHLSRLNTTADNGCRSTGVVGAGNGRQIGSYLRTAQAYMLISIPTCISTILGVFQIIGVS